MNQVNLGLFLVFIASILALVRAAPEEMALGGNAFLSTVKGLLSPLVMTSECFDNFIAFNIKTSCLTSSLSKVLGLGIIAGSFALKLPQVIGILKAKSADGIILSALYLETSSVASTSLYNIAVGTPITTYAESLVIFLQNILLIVLCWHYQKTPMNVRIRDSALGCAYIGAHFGIPPAYLPVIMLIATITSMSGRAQQILGNFKAKSTGVLSLTTTIMQVGGTAARVFTTLQEVNDVAILSSFAISFLLNLTILTQIIIYWDSKKPVSATLLDSTKDMGSKVKKSAQDQVQKLKKVD